MAKKVCHQEGGCECYSQKTKSKLLHLFSPHPTNQQGSPCCHNFLTVISSYHSNVTSIGPLHSKKLCETVLLYVFRKSFQASLLKRHYKTVGIMYIIQGLLKGLKCQWAQISLPSLQSQAISSVQLQAIFSVQSQARSCIQSQARFIVQSQAISSGQSQARFSVQSQAISSIHSTLLAVISLFN